MRKFILIDHSLRDLGGHHYPYAASVLQAAVNAGWSPVLATHREFRNVDAFPADWQVLPIFARPSYSRYTLDTQSTAINAAATGWRRGLGWLQRHWRQRHRTALAAQFAAGCAELFSRIDVARGDLVFVGTASELDLQGLTRFLVAARPGNACLSQMKWHLQFHFGMQRGRFMPDVARTEAIARMRESLRASLERVPAIRFHMWCTTDALSAQYTALRLLPFRTLPYPVHPRFAGSHTPPTPSSPARIACLGHARREKGHGVLPTLLRALWDDYFARGRAQLVVQNARPRLRQHLEQTIAELSAPDNAMTASVDCSAGALDMEQYAALVRASDIGLLLYDADRYHDRCSGVLLEMQVAAVPVIVPAESWLATQVDPLNQAWMRVEAHKLATENRLLPLKGELELNWIALPETCKTLLVQLFWPRRSPRSTLIRICLTQKDSAGVEQQFVLSAARHASHSTTLVLFRMMNTTTQFHLRQQRPNSTVTAPDTRLATWIIRGEAVPLGAVGLAIVDQQQAPEAVRDILDFLEHYRNQAAIHASQRAQDCSAAVIVARLTEQA